MPDHDFDEFDEHIDERRERVAGSKRLLIITLSVGCVALAISNIALATRVSQLRRASVAERTAVARTAVTEPAVAPEPRTPEPAAPAASIPSETPGAAARATSTPELLPPAPPRVAAEPERVAAELPPPPAPHPQSRVASAQRTPERAAATPSTPERATASWMVQEYGRSDAETRARSVADFYGAQSPEGAYWRRVLGEIVTAHR